jgi:DeoR family transcriptional regulator, fructose operon transcriptional repressor
LTIKENRLVINKKMAKNKQKKHTQFERIEQIRTKLLVQKEVSIETLAEQLNVSQMTIRRDLEQLENQGEVIRTHGGAAMARKLIFESAFHDKQHIMSDAKQKIACLAAKFVKTGDVIFLDTGTTNLEIAKKLSTKGNITVITTSLAIAYELQFSENMEVILLGGFMRKGSPDLHGPLTEQNIDFFRSDIAFIGADAVDIKGNTFTDDLRVVNLDRKMASHSKKVIITTDSSKFNKNSMCNVFNYKDYDFIITDSKVGKRKINQLHKNKIQVKVV